MHITGETLERAMAVLEGHASPSAPHTGPDTEADATVDREAGEDGEDGEDAPPSDSEAAGDGSKNAHRRDEIQTHRRRGHLRGL